MVIRSRLYVLCILVFGSCLCVFVAACRQEGDSGPDNEFRPELLPLPSDAREYAPVERYAPMPVPNDNLITVEKVALGRQIFFDKRFSLSGGRACYSCHLNEKGLSDGLATPTDAYGKRAARNSPTLWNVGYLTEFKWDGSAREGLERKVLGPWNGTNMGIKPDEVVVRLNSIQGYHDQFLSIFGEDATKENLGKAVASFFRTIISRDTPWDRWQRGDESAVSEAAKRGYKVFENAKCTNCHSGYFFSDQQYHNIGIGMDKADPDIGRFKVTKMEKHKGAFRTPTLRDVVDSGPYFHDGSVATLEDAVKIMVGGGIDNPRLDRSNLMKVDLTPQEFTVLLEFLKSLDEPTILVKPKLPPGKF